MEEKTLTIGFLTKLLTATMNLTAINEPDGKQSYQATKKRFQRLAKIDIEKLEKNDADNILNYCSQIDRWIEWAKSEGILKTWQQNAIAEFFDVLAEAALYNMPLNKNMTLHIVTYALASVLYEQFKDFDIYYPDEKDEEKYYKLNKTLSCFDFFGTDEVYLTDCRPVESTITIFSSFVNDIKEIYDYWQKNLPSSEDMDISARFEDWKKGVVPDWNSIRVFYNENMCPPSNYYNNELGTECYEWFKRNLYFSFCLSNFFTYLNKEKLLTDTEISVIRNGARLYFRDFYVIRDRESEFYSDKFEKAAKDNLMFRTLFLMLDGDMGMENTMTYLTHVYRNPEYPLLFDTKFEEFTYFVRRIFGSKG